MISKQSGWNCVEGNGCGRIRVIPHVWLEKLRNPLKNPTEDMSGRDSSRRTRKQVRSRSSWDKAILLLVQDVTHSVIESCYIWHLKFKFILPKTDVKILFATKLSYENLDYETLVRWKYGWWNYKFLFKLHF